MKPGLTPEEIALLETHTEGWIAGLQMADDLQTTYSGGH